MEEEVLNLLLFGFFGEFFSFLVVDAKDFVAAGIIDKAAERQVIKHIVVCRFIVE